MILLNRTSTSEAGTFGELSQDGNHLCYMVERPYTGDHPCIACGTYTFNQFNSPTKGNVWLRDDKAANDGRTMIEMHPANWARQLLGCLAPGRNIELIEGMMGVSDSDNTFIMLKAALPDSFELTITDSCGDNAV